MNIQNIIVEDNINLWDEINKLELNYETNINNNIEKCLLTNEPLTMNYIKLPCNHKFNYIPLYNEIYQLKITHKYNHFDKYKLDKYQIYCPYCRQVYNNLLPYIPIYKKDKVNLITHPVEHSLPFKKCEYIIKSGKKKGICNSNGFETEIGNRCNTHWKLYEKQKMKQEEKEKMKQEKDKNNDNISKYNTDNKKNKKSRFPKDWNEWTDFKKSLWNKKVIELRKILKEMKHFGYYKLNKIELIEKITELHIEIS